MNIKRVNLRCFPQNYALISLVTFSRQFLLWTAKQIDCIFQIAAYWPWWCFFICTSLDWSVLLWTAVDVFQLLPITWTLSWQSGDETGKLSNSKSCQEPWPSKKIFLSMYMHIFFVFICVMYKFFCIFCLWMSVLCVWLLFWLLFKFVLP